MLNDFFTGDRARSRHRATPFGAFLDGYIAHRRSQGGSFETIRNTLLRAAAFGEHLEQSGIDSIRKIDESSIEAFVDSYLSTPPPKGLARRRPDILAKSIRKILQSLLTYLRDIGVVERPSTPILDEFCVGDLRRFRHLATPIGRHLEGYIAHRRSQGYSFEGTRKAVRYASAFGAYLKACGIVDLREIEECHQSGFVEAYVSTAQSKPGQRDIRPLGPLLRRSLRSLLAYLRGLGVVSPAKTAKAPNGTIIDDYLTFLRDHRGLAPATIEGRLHWIRRFVEALARQRPPATISAELSARDVQAVVTDLAKPVGYRTQRGMVTAVKSFLSFLRDIGIIPRTCRPFLPRIPSYALASLPSQIEPDDIERALRQIDRSTPVGRRNYAMLILLGTYGLRSGELAKLRLEQFDWRQSTFVVWQSKTRRDLALPLLSHVREALVDYLRHGRPETRDRRVFQKVLPPLGPVNPVVIHQAVRSAFRRAGVEGPHCCPRALRHSVATAVVRSGEPLKVAGDLLGHRIPDATLTYCKLAVEDLRDVALEIPEGCHE